MKRTNLLIGLILIILTLLPTHSFSQEFDYLPKTNLEGQLVKKNSYALFYLEEHEQAAWVAYNLTKDDAFGNAERKDNFHTSSTILTGSATANDYSGSGYDRGHQIPAADAKRNQEDMYDTFDYLNVCPQKPHFNRISMLSMESNIRGYLLNEDNLYVITGPIFRNSLGSIGENNVTIPGAFYKVIYDMTPPFKMIGFILPHEDNLDQDLSNYVVSVDSIESVTKIDFFSQLEDSAENELEKESHYNLWNSNSKDNSSSNYSSNNKEGERCKGTAKSTGQRCKIVTTKEEGYCRYHTNQAG